MHLSSKGEYGIRAMLELTQRQGQGFVQSSEIAQQRQIPENYLYQLLITLRKAGLVRSRRGPQGGHMLSRPAEDISLAEIVIALEGPIEPTVCIQEGVVVDCPFRDRCALRPVWEEIAETTHGILESTSLDYLARREAEMSVKRGDA